jgi:hypothetical protein
MPPVQSHDQIYETFLSEIDAAAVPDGLAIPLWTEVCRQIQRDARTCDKFEFLRWPSLNDFSVPEAWIPHIWYTTLRINPCWSTRWFPLTRDTKVGRPKDFLQAWMIRQFTFARPVPACGGANGCPGSDSGDV